MIHIVIADDTELIRQARDLFLDYEKWIDLDLCFQSFESELASLPGKYSPPDGRLLVAVDDEKMRAAGCIAMRKMNEEGVCEMKRLFVRPEFRGHDLGNRLIDALLREARAEGYRKMRLDTFPSKMHRAVELYEARGFRPIEAYYANPHEGVAFMELDL